MADHSTPSTGLLKAQGVSKVVKSPDGSDLTILHDVSLSLNNGEAVAIVGTSGSGKSTLLGLLAGLDQATEGEIYLFGTALSALDEDARASLRAGRIGFVFQSFQLLPGMTALENVMLPLELSNKPDPKGIATQALERVGLSARVLHYPSQLSGGEQQRVAIARAFASEPKLLFADEPTGSIDQETGVRISNLLFDLREQTGAALLLVTHDTQLADRCDQRLLLETGRLEGQA
ncbi:MAG: ABC transporter [Sedimenticola sp.]|nr:MAG: ABC transporter [Sedimenticola sp.]